VGAASGCVIAAALATLRVPLSAIMVLGFLGPAASVLLPRRYYAAPGASGELAPTRVGAQDATAA